MMFLLEFIIFKYPENGHIKKELISLTLSTYAMKYEINARLKTCHMSEPAFSIASLIALTALSRFSKFVLNRYQFKLRISLSFLAYNDSGIYLRKHKISSVQYNIGNLKLYLTEN